MIEGLKSQRKKPADAAAPKRRPAPEVKIRRTVPLSCTDLVFQYRIFDDWFKQYIGVSYILDSTSHQWLNFFVQNIEYLANPNIKKKNSMIIHYLMKVLLPELKDMEQSVFIDVLNRINVLL